VNDCINNLQGAKTPLGRDKAVSFGRAVAVRKDPSEGLQRTQGIVQWSKEPQVLDGSLAVPTSKDWRRIETMNLILPSSLRPPRLCARSLSFSGRRKPRNAQICPRKKFSRRGTERAEKSSLNWRAILGLVHGKRRATGILKPAISGAFTFSSFFKPKNKTSSKTRKR